MSMIKCNSKELAETFAREQGLALGWSVLSPGWFVGTPKQLRAIGVLDPITVEPSPERKDKGAST